MECQNTVKYNKRSITNNKPHSGHDDCNNKFLFVISVLI